MVTILTFYNHNRKYQLHMHILIMHYSFEWQLPCISSSGALRSVTCIKEEWVGAPPCLSRASTANLYPRWQSIQNSFEKQLGKGGFKQVVGAGYASKQEVYHIYYLACGVNIPSCLACAIYWLTCWYYSLATRITAESL